RAERTILNQQRNLLCAARQTQSLFIGVAHDVETGESRINIEPSYTERVVVVPERLWALFVGVQIDCILTGGNPIFGIAVALRWNVRSVQMHDCSNCRHARFSPVNRRIHLKEMLRWKIVDPVHSNTLFTVCFKSRTRIDARISPKPGRRQIAMELLSDL